jgi:NAD(P)-dependent dehydrogenase (short-subunit alcohol dehydrogenase family)
MSRKTISAERSFAERRKDPAYEAAYAVLDGEFKFAKVDQVASLVVCLCSDAASQITDANLSIDGGWTAE